MQEATHVFLFWVEQKKKQIEALARTLSADEIKRACGYRFDIDRRRFITGRGWMRTILGYYLSVKPEEIEIHYSTTGKPQLSDKFARTRMHFNISHSGDLITLAITRTDNVGVDVEHIQSIDSADQIVAEYFTESERKRFTSIPKEERLRVFYIWWTCKEAWLKSSGEGLSAIHKSVDLISLFKMRHITSGSSCYASNSGLRLYPFAVGDNYVGAVASKTANIKFHFDTRYEDGVVSNCSNLLMRQPPDSSNLAVLRAVFDN